MRGAPMRLHYLTARQRAIKTVVSLKVQSIALVKCGHGQQDFLIYIHFQEGPNGMNPVVPIMNSVVPISWSEAQRHCREPG
jgi:hypothetical protein